MKKLFLLFFGLILTVNVSAKTYYSDYSEYKLSDIKIEESDIVDTKVEVKYLMYKENKIETFYPSYIEINDMTKTNETKIETSDWLDEKPNELIGRNIIEKQFYEYQDIKKIRYVKISNLINTKTNFDFAELIILNGLEKIDYDIKSDYEDINKIKDSDLESYVTFSKDDEIIIDLKQGVYIHNLKLGFHVHIDYTSDIYFTIELFGEEFENVYAERTIFSPLNTLEDNHAMYLIDEAHFNLVNPLYEEKQLSEKYVISTKFRTINLITKYKTEDLYIKYEKIEKQYLDDYYLEPIEGYYLDLNTKKEFYYIRTRDKVEIKDNLIIDNYDTKLEDFIISTTVDNIKITSNMNYYKNGTYDINFILPFKTINEKLKVNIAENYIKALQVQNNYLKELEQKNAGLIISNNKLNTQIKEVLQNKDKSINEVNDKIIKCKYELEELKENKQELGEELNEEKDYKLLIIIPIILILLLILFFLRKKSIQNNN